MSPAASGFPSTSARGLADFRVGPWRTPLRTCSAFLGFATGPRGMSRRIGLGTSILRVRCVGECVEVQISPRGAWGYPCTYDRWFFDDVPVLSLGTCCQLGQRTAIVGFCIPRHARTRADALHERSGGWSRVFILMKPEQAHSTKLMDT